MTKKIEVFYSFQSPYSYLAMDPLYDIQEKYNVELLWQPFSARASGNPVPQQGILPDKLSYLFEDTRRIAADRGLSITYPENWPEVEFDPGRITRGALIANDLGVLLEYNIKVFNKWWGLGEDPNQDTFMNELCDDLDIDLGDFLSKVSSSDTRERVKGIYKRGRKLGVFDTPTFVFEDGERIVGYDKIAYVAQRLDKMGLRKK
jgi:2-hydroxychromene-2-carboxylate isomerase